MRTQLVRLKTRRQGFTQWIVIAILTLTIIHSFSFRLMAYGASPEEAATPSKNSTPFTPSKDLLQELQLLQEEEVITGTWTLHPLKDSPIQVTIITDRMLEQAGATHIRQTLQDVPAIQIRPFASGFDSFQLQGVPDSQTLFMVNGQELIGSVGGQLFTRGLLATPAWESIEIVNGGTSVQYGSNAISGVINLRTKPGVEELGGTLFGQYGRHQSLTVFGAPEFSVGKLSGYFSFGATRSDGFDLTPNVRTDGSPEFFTSLASGQVDYRITDRLKVSVFSLYTNDDRTSQQNPTTSIPSIRESETRNRRLQAVFRMDWNPDTESTLTFWGHYQNFFDGADGARRDTDVQIRATSRTEELWEPQFQYTRSIGSMHLLTVGGEYDFRRARGGAQRGGQASVGEGALWAQNEMTMTEWLTVLVGGRYTSNTDSGGFFSPQATLLAKHGEWRSRFSYSRGFRSPDLAESDFLFVETGGFGVVGNPNLRPAKSHSFSLNLQRFFSRGQMGLTLFRHQVKNTVDFAGPCANAEATSIGLPTFLCVKAINSEDIRTQGLELDGTLSPWSWLSMTIGYMYVDAINQETDEKLFAVSPHSFKTRVRFHWQHWDATIRLRYFSSFGLSDANRNGRVDRAEKAPSNTQVDLRVSRRIQGQFEIYGGVENLTSARINVRSIIQPQETDPFWFFGMRLHL